MGRYRKKAYKGKTFVKKVTAVIKAREKYTVEHKYFDTPDDLVLLSATASVTDISAIPQGDTDRSRNGDKLLPVRLEIHYWINGETYSSIVRVIIFRWKPDSSAGVPSVGNILHYANNTGSVISPYVHDQRGLFTILYDKVHTVSNNGNELIQVNKILKMSMKPIDFSNNSTAGSNKIYSCFMTDRVLANSCTAISRTRLHFTDS